MRLDPTETFRSTTRSHFHGGLMNANVQTDGLFQEWPIESKVHYVVNRQRRESLEPRSGGGNRSPG